MTHYETLGLERDASPDDIKLAFRRAASAAHPDRDGGDPVRMAEINRANDVLSDPVKRQRYDQTGDDKAPPSLDQEVKSFLMGVIRPLMANSPEGQFLVDVLREINAKKGVVENLLQQGGFLRKKLEARRSKITTRGPENLVTMMIDAELDGLRRMTVDAEHQRDMLHLAATMMADYESLEGVAAPVSSYHTAYAQQANAAGDGSLFGFNP